MSSSSARTALAVLGGFIRPRDSLAHGTHHAAFVACEALARLGAHSQLDVFHENPAALAVQRDLVLPRRPSARLLDRTDLTTTRTRYQAIYVAHGEQIGPAPHVMRPHQDWAPVVVTVGSAHAAPQWQALLVALASASVRPADGFVFKSQAARALFRTVWGQWTERLGLQPPFPEASVVIPNGVDVQANRPSPDLRAETRRRLRLRPDDLVFLAFSRLSPGTKGDQRALVVRWKEVVTRAPAALLLLAGAQVDRALTMELRDLARAAGVADRVLILENPFELLSDARRALMSAADVFVHLTTGVEEASPMVIHEALAHALPVIATEWGGIPEIVRPGDNGFLVTTRAAPIAAGINTAVFGVTDLTTSLAASHSVASAFEEVPAIAARLAHPDLRQRLSAAARRGAEAHTADTVARTYVDLFARLSRQAEQDWPHLPAWRPLLEMDQVLAAQTAGRLNPTHRLQLRDPQAATLLQEGWDSEPAAAVAAALGAFDGSPEITVADLAARIAPPEPADPPRRADTNLRPPAA